MSDLSFYLTDVFEFAEELAWLGDRGLAELCEELSEWAFEDEPRGRLAAAMLPLARAVLDEREAEVPPGVLGLTSLRQAFELVAAITYLNDEFQKEAKAHGKR